MAENKLKWYVNSVWNESTRVFRDADGKTIEGAIWGVNVFSSLPTESVLENCAADTEVTISVQGKFDSLRSDWNDRSGVRVKIVSHGAKISGPVQPIKQTDPDIESIVSFSADSKSAIYGARSGSVWTAVSASGSVTLEDGHFIGAVIGRAFDSLVIRSGVALRSYSGSDPMVSVRGGVLDFGSVTVGGTVFGNITTAESNSGYGVVFGEKGRVYGNVRTTRLTMRTGALLDGDLILAGDSVSEDVEFLSYGGRITGSVKDEKESSSARFSYGTTYINGTLSVWNIQVDPYAVLVVGSASSAAPAITAGNSVVNSGTVDFHFSRPAQNEWIGLLSGSFEGTGVWRVNGKIADNSIFRRVDADGNTVALIYCAAPETSRKTLFVHSDFTENCFDLTENQTAYVLHEKNLLSLGINAFHSVAEALEQAAAQTDAIRVTGGTVTSDLEFFGKRAEIVGGVLSLNAIYGASSDGTYSVKRSNILIDGSGNTLSLEHDVTIFAGNADSALVTLRGLDASVMSSTDARFNVSGTGSQTDVVLMNADAGTISDTISVTMTNSSAKDVSLAELLEMSNSSVISASGISQILSASGGNTLGFVQSSSLAVSGGTLTLSGFDSSNVFSAAVTNVDIRAGATLNIDCTYWQADHMLSYSGTFRNRGNLDFFINNIFSGNDLDTVGLVRFSGGGRLPGNLRNFGEITVNGHRVSLAVSGDTLVIASVQANLETIFADSVLSTITDKEQAMLLGDRHYLLNENAFGGIDDAFDRRNWDASTAALHIGREDASGGVFHASGDLYAYGKRLEIIYAAISGPSESFTLYGGGSGQGVRTSEITIENSTLTGNLVGGNEKRSSIRATVTLNSANVTGDVSLNSSNGKSSVTINGLSGASSVVGSISGAFYLDENGFRYNAGTFSASGALSVFGALSGFRTVCIAGGENFSATAFAAISGGGSFAVSARKVTARAGGTLSFANGGAEYIGSGSAENTGTFARLQLENVTVSHSVVGGGQVRGYDAENSHLTSAVFNASGSAILTGTSVSEFFAGYRDVVVSGDSMINGMLIGGTSQWVEDQSSYASDLTLENIGMALVSRSSFGSLSANNSTFGDPVFGFLQVEASNGSNFYRGIFGGNEWFLGAFIEDKSFSADLDSVTGSRVSTRSRTASGTLLLQDSLAFSGGSEPFMETVSGFDSVTLLNSMFSGTLIGGNRLDKYTEVFDSKEETGKSTVYLSQWISSGSLAAENCQFFDGESTIAGFRSVSISGGDGLYHLIGGDSVSREKSERLFAADSSYLLKDQKETTSLSTGRAVISSAIFGVEDSTLSTSVESFASLSVTDVSACGELHFSGGGKESFETIISDTNGTTYYEYKKWSSESAGTFSALRSVFSDVSGYASVSVRNCEATALSGGAHNPFWKMEKNGDEVFTASSAASGKLLTDGSSIFGAAVGFASAKIVNSNVADLISMRLNQSELDDKLVFCNGDYTASGAISISEKYRVDGNSEYTQKVSAQGTARIINSTVGRVLGYAEVIISAGSTVNGMIASTLYSNSFTGLTLSGNVYSREVDSSDTSVWFRMTCKSTGSLTVSDSTLSAVQVLGYRKIILSGSLAENCEFTGGDLAVKMTDDVLTSETTNSGVFSAKNGTELYYCTFTDLSRVELNNVSLSTCLFIQNNPAGRSSFSFRNVNLTDFGTSFSGCQNLIFSQTRGTGTLESIDFSESGGSLDVASGFLRCDLLTFYDGKNDSIHIARNAVFSWCGSSLLSESGVDKLTGTGTFLSSYENALDDMDFSGSHRWFYGEGGENADDDLTTRTELALTRGGRTENWLGANGGSGNPCDTVDFLRIDLTSGTGVKLQFDDAEIMAECSFDGGLTWQNAASDKKIALSGGTGIDLRFELIGGAAEGVNSTFYNVAVV